MTVIEVCHINTNEFASISKLYPTEIQVPHHQLRNFIGVVREDRIYFVFGCDVYVLNLVTNQKTLVATVPFEARCLTAGHGWLGVGGETSGACAFIKIPSERTESDEFGLDLIVKMIGTEIVNSMTIHEMPSSHPDCACGVVTLISNNDKSVTLYSLAEEKALAVLKHPVCMNYATMSPDHKLIAAVGDSSQIFFYKRHDANECNDDHDHDHDQWELLATPKIPSREGVWDDYGFAITFSPNGQLCAVSAQGGCISVIDVAVLLANPEQPEQAVRSTFKSSRSGLWGCVRSMAFSPEPWDMLAWTEDHGRVGIADLRRNFTRRQCISLERDAATVVQVNDVTPAEYWDTDIKERLKKQHHCRSRNLQRPSSANSPAAVRNTGTEINTFAYTQGMDLDRQELSVMEALETTMNDVEHHLRRPYSINYATSPSVRQSATAESQRQDHYQHVNHRTHHTPRRRESVVLSGSIRNTHLAPPDSIRTMMTASPVPMSEETSTPPMSTNDLTPSNATNSQPMPHDIVPLPSLPYDIPPSDPWHVIEAALATRRDNSATVRSTPPNLTLIETMIAAERRVTTQLDSLTTDERRLSALLRSELEARERILELRQQAMQLEQGAESRLSPSLERVLHRQLQGEQENGRLRANELESERRINRERYERLMAERETLLHRLRRSILDDTRTSATSSALPIISSSRADDQELDDALRRFEQAQSASRRHIQNLETQLRGAESRYELASVRSSVERAEQRDRHQERLLDARFLSAARSGTSATSTLRRLHNSMSNNATATATQGPTTNRLRGNTARRTETVTSTASSSSSIPPTSELSGRVTDSETRIARLMLQRAAMDANGNWMSSQGLQRILDPRRMTNIGHNTTLPAGMAAMTRESGIGTAGISWGPDGRNLYIGSEIGIFQLTTHTQGRMYFPSVEMR